MAGIGFLLKKLIREDRYMSDVKMSLYSMVISSGPWIFAILCIAGLSVFSTPVIVDNGLYMFRVFVVYAFAFSLIITSIFQLVLTRFVSDRLYQREYSALLPNLYGALFVTGLVCFVLGWIFVSFTDLDFFKKVMFLILLCAISFQWIVMIIMSALRDYVRLTFNFLLGYTLSFLAALILGKYMGINGYILGFTLGQAAIVILVTNRITEEFTFGRDGIFEFTGYFSKYKTLAFSALGYAIGIWADKFIIWYSPLGRTIEGGFRSNIAYDTCSFLAILSIVPTMTIFIVQVETVFYENLRKYINVIMHNGTLQEIEQQRKTLAGFLRDKIMDIMKIQLMVSLMLFFLSHSLLTTLGFDPWELGAIFMVSIFGAFFHAIFLVLIVLFWYLELLNESVICVTVFAVLNIITNLVLVYLFPNVPLGTGYLITTLVSFTVTIAYFANRVKNLNYIVFMKRPMAEGMSKIPTFE